MKKIIILSDIHQNNSILEKMKGLLDEADIILFCGDGIDFINYLSTDNQKKVYAVGGNCDFTGEKELIFNIDNKKILLTHGHIYNVKYTMDKIVYRAKEVNADIVVYGHTHTPKIEEISGVLCINPGTLTRYEPQKTFGYMVIDGDKAVATINDRFFA